MNKSTTSLYTDQQAAELIAQIPLMMAESEVLKARNVAPTIDQRLAISCVLWDFVAKKERIVYGGHALNAALLRVSPADAIYPSRRSATDPMADCHFPDIEFYSPDPVADVVEICRRLYVAGHKYVQGKEAAHAGTFTVSVEFVRVCDVTYVPQSLHKAIPTIEYAREGRNDRLVMIDPSFSMLDYLRMLSDPFSSHWKLDKMIPRMILVDRFFPMPFVNADEDDSQRMMTKKKNRPELLDNNATNRVDELTEAVRTSVQTWLAARPTTVAVGQDALAYFEKAAAAAVSAINSDGVENPDVDGVENPDDDVPVAVVVNESESDTKKKNNDDNDNDDNHRSRNRNRNRRNADYNGGGDGHHVTVLSLDFEHDVVDFSLDYSTVIVKTKERHPLLDLLGRSATMYLANKVTVTLIDFRHKSIPIVDADPAACGMRIASFAYTLMISLGQRFGAEASRLFAEERHHAAVCGRLLRARSKFLADTGSTTVDRWTPFRDVGTQFLGVPASPMRRHMLDADQRRAKAASSKHRRMPHEREPQVWFTFDPSKSQQQQPQYVFPTIDGSLVRNANELVLTLI